MKVLAKDEKYQQANLEILEVFKAEANPQVRKQKMHYDTVWSGINYMQLTDRLWSAT